ncbi:MAG: hypothetical protein BEN19_06990 [Epulopiscium sp. Nuni2H_MBin003]|nr:MAG: hypothetical protein BEN19_06990 [Epulopiscium sp. Nuni2H_MBin003]
MKRQSITFRIAFLNTVFMSLMVGFTLAVILTISETVITQNSQATLKNVVYDNVEEIRLKNGKLEFDDLEFEEDGVKSAIFDSEMQMIQGVSSTEFQLEHGFMDGAIQEVYVGTDIYIIYDRKIPNIDLWVRGIIVLYDAVREVRMLIISTVVILPIFVIIGTIGSYLIARNSLHPINKIVDTAKMITKGTDLTQRINLDSGGQELYELARTFDEMFDRLERSFDLEKQFVSDVSHEIRTPITVILAQCEFAKDSNIQDKNEAFEVITRQAGKMKRLIAELLMLSRMDRGFEKINLDKVNLSELLYEICDEQKIIMPCEIKMDIEKDIVITLDEMLINRLIINLISNAYKYSGDDGVIKVSLKKVHNGIDLLVEDNGIGIKKEDIAKIWRRFYQVEMSRSDKESMGLGLSMVSEIAKLHNAKVSVESEVGVGSCFKVEFETKNVD